MRHLGYTRYEDGLRVVLSNPDGMSLAVDHEEFQLTVADDVARLEQGHGNVKCERYSLCCGWHIRERLI